MPEWRVLEESHPYPEDSRATADSRQAPRLPEPLLAEFILEMQDRQPQDPPVALYLVYSAMPPPLEACLCHRQAWKL